MKRRTIAACAATAVACLALTAAATANPDRTAAPKALTKITFMADYPRPPWVAQIPWVVAMDKGWYKAAGLDVKYVFPATPADPARFIGIGRADITVSYTPDLLTAASKGLKVKALASVFDRNVEGIMDNSFLIEEAYNQEPGVVQHILNAAYGLNRLHGSDEHDFGFSFTQEWPIFSQTHQFSYTIPYSLSKVGSTTDKGIGDVFLNYRYQVLLDERTLTGFAPRFSLVLPTGDTQARLGSDSLAYQWNLPFSTALNDFWFVHANAGLTFLPKAGPSNQDFINYNLGASAIWAATPTFHVMLEWVGTWNESDDELGHISREFQSVISPGVRRAFNFANDAQLVLGLAVPVGLTGSAPDIGVFFYLSYEHRFLRKSE